MVAGAVGVAHNGGGACSQPLALLHSSMPVRSLFVGSPHIHNHLTAFTLVVTLPSTSTLTPHIHGSTQPASLLSLPSPQHVPLTALVSVHTPAFESSAQGPSLSSPALYALPGEMQSLPVHDE